MICTKTARNRRLRNTIEYLIFLLGLEHLNTFYSIELTIPKTVYSIIRCMQLHRCPGVLQSLYFSMKTNDSILHPISQENVASLFFETVSVFFTNSLLLGSRKHLLKLVQSGKLTWS